MPVARDVRAHAADRPRQVALRSPTRVCTYRQLASDVETAARILRARGAQPGRLVAIDLAEPLEMITALLASDLVGALPLVCDAHWSAEQRTVVLTAVDPDLHVDVLAGPEDSIGTVTGAGPDAPAGPDDLSWAGFSSGSTGRPRAVARSRASWTASYPAVEKLTGLTAADTVLVPGPLASSLYCFAALHGLAAGASVLVTGRWSPSLAGAFLPDADIVHTVPHVLEQILAELEAGAQSRLRTAVVGGAALPGQLRERAATLGVGVVAYYGAVELSFVAVDPDGQGLRPFDDVEIDLRPVDSRSTLGEVWVRSPWIAAGYLAGATGPFRRDDHGWATVGDLADLDGLASRDTRAELRLRGRGDGAVQTGGGTVVPEDVEAVIAEVPGVAGVVVVGTPHDRLGSVVTAVVETDGRTVARELLEERARRELSVAQRPRRWYAVDRLPLTATGKPARSQVSEGLMTGTLRARTIRRSGRDGDQNAEPFPAGAAPTDDGRR